MVTVFAPSLAAATKSLAESSATVRFTVRLEVGAGLAFTVNTALPPSVTALPPVTVMVGGAAGASSSSTVTATPPVTEP